MPTPYASRHPCSRTELATVDEGQWCEEAVKTAWTLNNNSVFDEGVYVIGSHR